MKCQQHIFNELAHRQKKNVHAQDVHQPSPRKCGIWAHLVQRHQGACQAGGIRGVRPQVGVREAHERRGNPTADGAAVQHRRPRAGRPPTRWEVPFGATPSLGGCPRTSEQGHAWATAVAGLSNVICLTPWSTPGPIPTNFTG